MPPPLMFNVQNRKEKEGGVGGHEREGAKGEKCRVLQERKGGKGGGVVGG